MPKGVYERQPQAIDNPALGAPAVVGATVDISQQLAELQRMREQAARELAEAQSLKAKFEMKMEVRSNVAEMLAEQDQRRKDFGKIEPVKQRVMPPKPDEKLIEMKLERNYAPCGYYEIVGWHKPAVFKKFPDGQLREVEKAEFIRDEPAPSKVAGLAFHNKLWADTVARFPESEAKIMRRNGIGSVELVD